MWKYSKIYNFAMSKLEPYSFGLIYNTKTYPSQWTALMVVPNTY